MLIQREQTIVGLPAVEVRRVLRELRSVAWTRLALGELAPPGTSGNTLFRRLRADEFIELAPRGMRVQLHSSEHMHPRPQLWTTTVKGTALAKARIGKPMPRAKAERILADFLARVEEANADPEGLYWIEWVDLFGSMADPTREEVGDIDLQVLAVGRYDHEEQIRREREATTAAMKAGRSLNTQIDQLGYPQNRLRRALKQRSKLIDMQLDVRQPSPIPDGARTVRVYRRGRPELGRRGHGPTTVA